MKRAFATLAAGRAENSPFGPILVGAARGRLVQVVGAQSLGLVEEPGDQPQPIRIRLLAALLKGIDDPDVAGIARYARGVRLGVGVKLPRTPAVYPRKVRWALPSQKDPDGLGDGLGGPPVLLENYSSAKVLEKEVEADLDDLVARGLAEVMEEAEARRRFGNDFVVASLGALVKRTELDGSKVVRILFDGTHEVPLNDRIQVRDQEIPPNASDLKRLLSEQAEDDSRPFGLVADVKDAHRAVAIAPVDWHLLGCRARRGGPLYFQHRGTFGIASASYWWGRLAAAILRLGYAVVAESAALWSLVLADDFKYEVCSPNFVETLLLLVLLGEVLGVPWSWSKLRGGTEYTWVGFQHQLLEHSLGLSESRALWLQGWLDGLIRDRIVIIRDFLAGLGRAAFACGALEYDRPFLAPLYTFGSLRRPETRQPLPTYVLVVAKFLRDRLRTRRLHRCAVKRPSWDEAIRIDAKAEGSTATLGGWRPTRDQGGTIVRHLSPWFFVSLNPVTVPWAYERDNQPFRVVASLEALAALVAVLLLVPAGEGGELQKGSLLLPLFTDNRGNTFALSRLMTTKYPLCLIVMELATVMEQRGLILDTAWAPREWNAEADALTNERFEGFDPALRKELDLPGHQWQVLGQLLKDGQGFYAEVQEARAAARSRGPRARRGGRKRKQPTLKERDPW